MSKKLIGSTVIISGMAVGAGMLAIPIATAQLGFMNSLLLMLGCWALMTVSALVLLQVTLKFDKNKNSFSQMAGSVLGKPGKVIMYVSFLSFIYALISAYLTGGASMITNLTSYLFNFHIPHEISGALFLLTLGGFIYISTSMVDKVNRFLFSGQMIVFIILLALFMPQIDVNFLMQSEHALWYVAAPVVLTSFGFHTVIPSLVTYMGDEAPKLKWALIFGSLVPLVCYAFWQVAILGTLPLEGADSFAALRESNGSIGEMVVMISHTVQASSLSTSLALFTNLALMTSFLGVSLSLFDFWNKNLSEAKRLVYKKPLAFGLTFIPPFLFTLAFPQGFARALAYGAVFEAILCIILPVAMAYVMRVKIWGGKSTLGLLTFSGLGMVGLDFFINNVL